MAITAKAGNSSNPATEGVHLALCTRIIDLGTQESQLYANRQHKVMFTWEIPDDTVMVDGEEKPKLISKEYTLSLNEKATLRGHLEAWRGKQFTDEELKGFDLYNVLGKACQIQVLRNERGYANISAIMALPKAVSMPQPSGELIFFDLSSENCLPLLEKLPEWVRDKIKASPEYGALIRGQADISDEFQEVDGDLPF